MSVFTVFGRSDNAQPIIYQSLDAAMMAYDRRKGKGHPLEITYSKNGKGYEAILIRTSNETCLCRDGKWRKVDSWLKNYRRMHES